MIALTLNNGVRLPALGFGVFQTPADETRDAVRAALDVGYRHIDTAAAYGNEREVGEAVSASGARPLRRLPRDQDLDLRLRVRGDAARVREERRKARRRPDRPAHPPPGPAQRLRPDARGLPGARDVARRWQGPRDRRQQLHGRPPHHAARPRRRRPRRQPDRGAPLLRPARGPGLRRRARHPHPGLVADRRDHLLPRERAHQHAPGPGDRRHRAGARQDSRPGHAALGDPARAARSSRSPPSPAASPRTSTSSTSSSPPTRWPRSTRSTPAAAAARSPKPSRSRRSDAPSRRPDRDRDALAGAARGRLDRDARDAAPLDADRRQDPPGAGADGQPLVAGDAVRDAARADDVGDAVRRPARSRSSSTSATHRLRITRRGRRARARSRWSPRPSPTFYAEVDGRARRRWASTIAIWPVPVEIEHAVPFDAGHRARALRPRRRAAVLAPARAGRPGDDRVPRALRRQGQPGALLLGRDRPGRDAVLGPDRAAPSRRRAQLRRLGDGRGLLARAGQLRLLAGRRRGRRLLRLRLPGARRLRRPRRCRRRRVLLRRHRPVPAALRGGPHGRGSGRELAGVLADHVRARRPTWATGTAPRSSTSPSRAPARTAEQPAVSGGVPSAPERIRTSDLRFRRPTLYPAELRAQAAARPC